ncbi:MAG TPA: hypothetical protein VGB96_04875 [Archangium sp.]
MEATQASKGGLRVAVTGAAGDMGRLLLPLLERDPDVESILVLDVARPAGDKVDFHRVDLTRHDAEAELAEVASSAGHRDAESPLARLSCFHTGVGVIAQKPTVVSRDASGLLANFPGPAHHMTSHGTYRPPQ